MAIVERGMLCEKIIESLLESLYSWYVFSDVLVRFVMELTSTSVSGSLASSSEWQCSGGYRA